MEYKYYSVNRPISIGTYPKKNNIEIRNYENRRYVDEIMGNAWGELKYSEPLTEKDMFEYELKESKEQEEFIISIKSIEKNIEQLQKDLENSSDTSSNEINIKINELNKILDEIKKERETNTNANNKEITFYVCECMEFPSLGKMWEGIDTVENAIKIFKELPNESKNMGNGLGVEIVEEDGYKNKISIYENGNVDTLEYYPEAIRENENVKNAIKVLKDEFERDIPHGDKKERIEQEQHEETTNKTTKKLSVKDETLEKLRNGIKETLDSKKFAQWCSKQGKLYMNNYSFTNAMLTYIQNPNASYVMGYEAWKAYGRQVNKGAKGIKILAPVMVKEYGKGGLLGSIKKSCMGQFKQNPQIEFANFKLGQTKMSFNMYKNGLFDIKIGDEVKMAHITSEELRKFLDRFVIGKIPAYYNAVTVFDVKDTTSDVEYLWVKDGFKKEELVVDEDGKPITNKRGQFKILNSNERKSKFNINDEMTIKKSDEKKMNILYDVLKTISEKNDIPVDEVKEDMDENLRSGALGYYKRPTEEYYKGNIVINDRLDITNKVSVLFHEMAHSEMHRDLDELKETMQEINNEEIEITRSMRETQAEAVAYMTASNFGIETQHKSFEYIAGWSNGRELKELEQSLSFIYKKSKELMSNIEKELDDRGMNLKIEFKEQKNMSQEEKETLVKKFKEYYLAEIRENEEIQQNAIEEFKDVDDEIQKNIIKEQIYITKQINDKLEEFDKEVEKVTNESLLNKAVVENKLNSQIQQIELLKKKIDKLSEERVNVINEEKDIEKADLKTLYSREPIKAIDKLKDEYKEMENLNDVQIKFIANSKYISKEYSKFLGADNEKFINLSKEHLKNFEDVMSKNKTVVEISSCEQWGDSPIFKAGELIHPKIANKMIQEAEKQIQALKKVAQAQDEYYPYTKCKLTVYSIIDDKLSAVNTRIDIGDKQQKNLLEHMQQICSKSKGTLQTAILENFSKSTRERGKAIMIEPIDVKENTDFKNKEKSSVSLNTWKNNVNTFREENNFNAEKEQSRGER